MKFSFKLFLATFLVLLVFGCTQIGSTGEALKNVSPTTSNPNVAQLKYASIKLEVLSLDGPLSGALVTLRKEGQDFTQTTGPDGITTFKITKPGTYFLKEIIFEGYDLISTEQYNFEITQENIDSQDIFEQPVTLYKEVWLQQGELYSSTPTGGDNALNCQQITLRIDNIVAGGPQGQDYSADITLLDREMAERVTKTFLVGENLKDLLIVDGLPAMNDSFILNEIDAGAGKIQLLLTDVGTLHCEEQFNVNELIYPPGGNGTLAGDNEYSCKNMTVILESVIASGGQTIRFLAGDIVPDLTGINALEGQLVSVRIDAITAGGPGGGYSATVTLRDENGQERDTKTVSVGEYINEVLLVDGLKAIEETLYVEAIGIDAQTGIGWIDIIIIPSGPVQEYDGIFSLLDEEGQILVTKTVSAGENLRDLLMVESIPALLDSALVTHVAINANTGIGSVKVEFFLPSRDCG